MEVVLGRWRPDDRDPLPPFQEERKNTKSLVWDDSRDLRRRNSRVSLTEKVQWSGVLVAVWEKPLMFLRTEKGLGYDPIFLRFSDGSWVVRIYGGWRQRCDEFTPGIYVFRHETHQSVIEKRNSWGKGRSDRPDNRCEVRCRVTLPRDSEKGPWVVKFELGSS